MAQQDLLFDSMELQAPDPAVQHGLAALGLIDGTADQMFDYSIPERLEGKVQEGTRVRISLRNQQTTGTVLQVRLAHGPAHQRRLAQPSLAKSPRKIPPQFGHNLI